jgi:hypothetical protein
MTRLVCRHCRQGFPSWRPDIAKFCCGQCRTAAVAPRAGAGIGGDLNEIAAMVPHDEGEGA